MLEGGDHGSGLGEAADRLNIGEAEGMEHCSAVHLQRGLHPLSAGLVLPKASTKADKQGMDYG